MSDPMQEIRASFFVECEELLEAMQDGLTAMDEGATDSETINVVFRAVHSIKGGAGAFGLDQLVSFAHTFETAMDAVRDGSLTPDAQIMALFFQCGDLLSDIVRAARNDSNLDDATLGPVVEQLEALVGAEDAEEVSADDFQPMTIALDLPGLGDSDGLEDLPPLGDFGTAPESGPGRFDIRFTPASDLYESGNEPLFLLRALSDIGTTTIGIDPTGMPDLGDFSSRSAFLSWTIGLETEKAEADIREVFEFVDGLCELSVDASPSDIDFAPSDDGTEQMSEDEETLAIAAPTDPPTPAPIETPSPPQVTTSEAGRKPRPDANESRTQSASKATVRVDLERIDRLVNLVGELVINQAMLSQSMAEAGLTADAQVASGLDEFQQLTRDIQDSVMMIRAQPVKSLFQRMGRIVRESAAEVDKKVRLRTEGEATEIDKTVIERLSDPLTHMIRNAVDHGLESTDDRRVAGKPEEGLVTLTASHRSGRVVIDVCDDGGGINRPKVKRIAEEKGLIAPDLALSDTEIDNLLFLPGFSTASTVSNLSGRGVGMDVVKNAISALGGRISITSEPGIGTTFSISLPLTLAVLDGMVIRVRDETLVVPLSAVSETLSLKPGDCKTLGPNRHVVQVRDAFVPLVDLAAELGYDARRDNYDGAIVLLLSQEDDSRAAVVVDMIEDQRQVVIKGLQDSYGHVPGVAAATILGDGQIALILDPADLLSRVIGPGLGDPLTAQIA